MKKLLSILLTLVMTIGLVNLNSSYTKADDNTEIFLGKNSSGVYGLYNDDACTQPYSGTITGITVPDTTKAEFLMTNVTMNSAKQFSIQVVTDATLTFSGTNNITVTGDDHYGIYSNGHNVTIKSKGNPNDSLNFNNGARTKGIEIYNPSTLNLDSGNIKFSGSGDFSGAIIVKFGAKLVIKDANIEASYNNGNNTKVINITGDNFTLTGNGSLKASTTSTAAFCYYGNINDPQIGNVEIVASAASDGTDPVSGTFLYDGSSYTNIMAGTNIAKYVKIVGKEDPVPPTPSPDPQPKDESCEKVIGPTWHWNNEKGICEEYATVGTSTR